eukprot:CAMPEP_0197687348 /NCGR_PEP_ID=MMETSP1338-20131121/103855_1 /TAXON_ID=43686 ORGANISM="Pelagodinium beii, Strain RCC1491" /NCGR_SAMPLE_ID=MMETSP1338 /ASSEMBLY_ACC=CAM_ASM_000754 /LENGTH=180 /DNA_ID=CAMNT_0043269429 /DNA_START=183 /DNA_END=721 /DNA_ORIENTATION=-
MIPSDDRRNTAAGSFQRGNNQERETAKSMVAKAWMFDPAQVPEAEAKYRHLLQEVEVANLRQSHDKVWPTFANGPHKGQNVKDLVTKMERGDVKPEDLTPLVAIRDDHGTMTVVFGNRRLTALKLLERSSGAHVKVRCIVWDVLEAPAPLAAKLVLSKSSQNGGEHAEIKRPSSKGPKGR